MSLGLISEEHTGSNTYEREKQDITEVKNLITILRSPDVSFISVSKEEEKTSAKFASLR